jgi:hypothetical protein
VTRLAASLALLFFALACGKYGPPVRASAAAKPAKAPESVIPLPVAPESAPSPEPAPAPEPPREEEPPPEGSP